MNAGKIEQVGTPKELIEQPTNDFVRDFIGVERIERNLGIGKRKLVDFESLFDKVWTGEAMEVPFSMTIQEAARTYSIQCQLNVLES